MTIKRKVAENTRKTLQTIPRRQAQLLTDAAACKSDDESITELGLVCVDRLADTELDHIPHRA